MAKQDFTITANIPDGWEPTGEYRCPREDEWYLYFPHCALQAGANFLVEQFLILRKIEPVRESWWMNVYPPVDQLCQYDSRAQCTRSAAETAIGIIRIDYENGVPVHVALEPAEGEG